jgi:hypothetical protein
LALPVDLAVPRCENVAIALVLLAGTLAMISSCKVPQLEHSGHFPYICGKSAPQLLHTYRDFAFAIQH